MRGERSIEALHDLERGYALVDGVGEIGGDVRRKDGVRDDVGIGASLGDGVKDSFDVGVHYEAETRRDA